MTERTSQYIICLMLCLSNLKLIIVDGNMLKQNTLGYINHGLAKKEADALYETDKKFMSRHYNKTKPESENRWSVRIPLKNDKVLYNLSVTEPLIQLNYTLRHQHNFSASAIMHRINNNRIQEEKDKYRNKRSDARDSYICPSRCQCATVDSHTLDKVQLLCEATIGFSLDQIQAEMTTNLYLNCDILFRLDQSALGSFAHLRQLEELSLTDCFHENVQADVFCGLSALKTLNITSQNPLTYSNDVFKHTPNLEIVNFFNQRLTALPPGVFCSLSQLRHVELSSNIITSQSSLGLAHSDCHLTQLHWFTVLFNSISGALTLPFSDIAPNLRVLSLHKNLITEIDESSFYNLTQLVYLDISSNRLRAIDSSLLNGLSALEILYMNDNQFECITPEILDGKLSLKLFIAKNNPLQWHCFEESMFQNTPALEYLDLSFTSINRLPGGLLINLTRLKEFFFVGNNLERIEPNTWSDVQELKMLNLSRNHLNAFKTIGEAQNAKGTLFSELQLLDLSYNIITTENLNLSNLPRIEAVFLQHNYLQNVPRGENVSHTLHGIDLSHNDIETIDPADFLQYSGVTVLLLRNNRIVYVPKDCFEHMPLLEGLDLSQNAIDTLERSLFVKNRALEEIDLSGNKISEIDLVFYGMVSLKKVDLSGNQITTVSATDFPPSLETINLSSNRITFIHGQIFLNITRLREVVLTNNRIQYIYQEAFRVSPKLVERPYFYIAANPYHCTCRTNYLKTVNRDSNFKPGSEGQIALAYIADYSSILCVNFDDIRLSLEFLVDTGDILCSYDFLCELKDCECSQTCNDLTTPCSCRQICPENCLCLHTTDRNENHVVCIERNFTQVPVLPNKATFVDLSKNSFQHMEAGVFINSTHLLELNLSKSGIKHIQDGTFLGPSGLKHLDLHSNMLSIIRNTTLLGLNKVTRLNLSHNSIRTVQNGAFAMLTLNELDLRHNKLQILSSKVFLKGNTTLSSLYLSHNNWSCDCVLGHRFQDWLTENAAVVKDIKHVVCGTVGPNVTVNETNTPVLSANFSQCLPPRMETVLKNSTALIALTVGISCVFAILVVLIIVIFMKRHFLQVWLYSRFGVRIYRTKENEDLEYDAFISYSNKDQAIVVNELLPRLEEGDPPYKLCVHFRDWLVGGGIASSVVQSINASRRTILLLSKNFLESEWCNYEFQTAHHRMISDKNCHLIVVLLDTPYPEITGNKQDDAFPFSQSELGPELQYYIKTYTYIRYSDPWFWQRLKFALPQVSAEQQERRRQHKLRERKAIEEQRAFLENRVNSQRIITSHSTASTNVEQSPMLTKANELNSEDSSNIELNVI